MSLIPEPVKPDKIQINYVKQAKVIDVKELKQTLWEDLQDVKDKVV
jgi:hypothetical protein